MHGGSNNQDEEKVVKDVKKWEGKQLIRNSTETA